MYIIVTNDCKPVPVRFYGRECILYKESDAIAVLNVLLDRIGDHFKVMELT